MDFLSNYVVRLDFDAGKLQLLRASGRDPGREIPIVARGDGVRLVRGGVGELGREWFLIDTGALGVGHSGSIRWELMRELLATRGAVDIANGRVATVLAAGREVCLARLKGLELGEFRHQGLLFAETQGSSKLGNDYWCRYIVTFDFPHDRMFLKKSKRFARPAALDKSGLHLLKIGEEITVDAVDPGSPADKARVRRGDVLIAVGNTDVRTATLRSIRLALCAESSSASLTMERAARRFNVLFRFKSGASAHRLGPAQNDGGCRYGRTTKSAL